MAQHDYGIDNDTGANVRSDINNVLAAIVSNNSGTSEPATTFAFQFWVDTTNNLLKIRNAANSAWVTIGVPSAANLGLLSLAGGTLTGQLLLNSAATVGAPDIAFAGDADSGLYRISANKFAVVVNGVAVMTFDAATYTQHNSTAAILMPIGTTAQRPTGTAGLMRYNSDLTQFEGYKAGNWGSLGGGGGGAGFVWRPVSGTAPVESEENGEIVRLFGAALAQELYAAIKIPQSYSAGTQIKLYVSSYSASTSNTQLFKAQSTLIRSGTDAFTSTTNQRTTTNSALTNSVANQLVQHVLDITDSSGQINSVAVSAGDIVKVRLYRDATDTDTADVRLISNSTDVKFS